MNVEHSIILWLLLTIPLMAIYLWRQQVRQGIEFSHLPLLEGTPKSARQQWLWLPQALYLAALASIIVAMAKPCRIVADTTQQQEGIAMSVVLDVSTSMNIRMEVGDGKRKTRMSVAKQLLEDFILGDGDELEGRSGDLISLISFARYARVESPLTDAHEALAAIARNVHPPTRMEEDGTAIGDATALGAAQLAEYERDYDLSEKVKSKVLVLITDGENNSGTYSPLMAASLAKEWGIRIYSIFIGNDPGGRLLDNSTEAVRVDWVLQSMSDMTGGAYQRAYDYESLVEGYKAINELERSSLQSVTFHDNVPAFQPWVLLALLSLTIAALLNATWLRRHG